MPIRIPDHLWVLDQNTGCHIWLGALRGTYPRPSYKQEYVNRIVCEAEHGPPPTRKHQAAHATPQGCIGGLCINPAHVRWATNKENANDVPVELRSEIARKAHARSPAEKRREWAKKVYAVMSPKQRSERARKAYATALAKGFDLNADASARMKRIWRERRAGGSHA